MPPFCYFMGTLSFDKCTLQSISYLNDCNLNFPDKEKAISLHSRGNTTLNFIQIMTKLLYYV